MNQIQTNRTQQIITAHKGLVQSLRQSVETAILIGGWIEEQKAEMEHGDFLSWLQTVPFSQKTANNYVHLYVYKSKLVTVTNLQEAYQIATREEQEANRKKQIEQDKLIKERIKTGKKPEGWERSTDYAFKKQQEKAGFEDRKKEAFEIKDEPKEESHKSRAESIFEEILKETKEDETLGLSDLRNNVKQKGIFAVIEEHISSLANPNEQLESIHNIIKKLRLLAIECQRKTI